MGKVLDQAVTQRKDGTWDFQCPGIKGDPCGDIASGQGFLSTGWPTKATATARGAEHFAAHKGEASMSTLEDFRAAHNLGVNAGGNAVSLKDI